MGIYSGNYSNSKLLIFGAGGHGRVVMETAEAMRRTKWTSYFEEIAFLDDNPELEGVIGRFQDYEQYINDYPFAFVAIEDNELRKIWLEKVANAGFKVPVLVHPTAYVSPSAMIGEGSIVGAKAVVNTKAVLEKGAIIGIGVMVDHDSLVDACSHINSGAIVKAGCRVESMSNIDSGVVYSG